MKFLIALLITLVISAATISAQTTAFTYQGKLTDGSVPANGVYTMQFDLFAGSSGGTVLAFQSVPAVSVANGIFTVNLDFGGGVFDGSNRYLEITVAGTPLTPRQQITSSPYSIRTLSAGTADGLTNLCVGCVTNANITSVSGAKVTGTVASAASAGTAVNVSGVVAIANGGTGATNPSIARANLGLDPNQQLALRFDATKGHHVTHGPFWLPGVNYTSFYWDMLVRPTLQNGTGYIISAGYGGGHNLLIGTSSSSTHFQVTGNIWNGASTVSFGSPGSFALGEWHHIAVQWDLNEITVYVNGVIEGITPYVAANRSTPSGVESTFFVGGSDHNMWSGDIAWIRGFEGTLPGVPGSHYPFRVNKWPMVAINNSGSTIIKPQFVADYTLPAGMINDLSDGLNGVRHPGIRAKGARVGGFLGSYPAVILLSNESDLPQWVPAVITAPDAVTTVTVPPTAKVYDSFSNREYSPFWSDASGLGSTEGGTAGIQAWTGTAFAYGISAGSAFPHTSIEELALIDVGSQTQDIRVIKQGSRIILYARFVDINNCIYAAAYGETAWVVGKVVAGVATELGSGSAVVAAPTTVRLVVSGTSVQLYTDGTLRTNVTDGGLPTGTKAGFALGTSYLAKVNLFEVY